MNTKIKVTLDVVNDGEASMDFLLKRGECKEVATPYLIVLDFSLQKVDGREVLRESKLKKQLQSILVIVLNISDVDKDVVLAYALHANCFIKKPLDSNKFVEVIKSPEEFLFTSVKLLDDKYYD